MFDRVGTLKSDVREQDRAWCGRTTWTAKIRFRISSLPLTGGGE